MAVSMAIIPSSMRDLQIIWGQSSVPGGLSIVMRTEINGHPDCRLLMVNKLSSIIPTARYLGITIIILGTYSEDRSDFFSHIHVRLVQVSRNSRWKLANSNKTERQEFYKLIWVMTDERISKILMHSYDSFCIVDIRDISFPSKDIIQGKVGQVSHSPYYQSILIKWEFDGGGGMFH